MKTRGVHLLINVLVIGLLTTSCTVYRNKVPYSSEGMSTSQTEALLNDLAVNDKVYAVLRNRGRITGKVIEINETNFVIESRKFEIPQTIYYQQLSEIKYDLDAGLSVFVSAVSLGGLFILVTVVVAIAGLSCEQRAALHLFLLLDC